MVATAFLILMAFALLGAFLWRLFSLEAPQIPLPIHPPSRPGLCYFGHRADRRFPFQHLFIRITPADGDWVRRRPDLFGRTDEAGLPFCTLGAGPKDGKLFLAFNRGFDLGDPASFEDPIACRDLGVENAAIAALLAAAEAYDEGLAFAAWSRISGPGYNCNSMIYELSLRAGLPRPRFARHWFLCPGFGRRLPAAAFSAGNRP